MDSKRKRVFLASVVTAVLLAVGLGVEVTLTVRSRTRMPVYQGRTARQWLDQIFTTNQAAAFSAFRVMGTNALPFLVRVLSDSQWDRSYGSVYSNMPVAIRKRMAVPISRSTWTTAELVLLNNRDTDRVFPDLAQLVANKQNRARQEIMNAIRIRPGERYDRFIPTFVDCLSDPDPAIRGGALIVLSKIGAGANPTTVKLTAALHDSSSYVRIQAAFALWKIQGTNGSSFGAAKATLETEMLANSSMATMYMSYVAPDYPGIVSRILRVLKNDPGFQAGALFALQNLGSDAKEAVPALLELLDQRRPTIPRQTILQTLEKIDPEAARKYKEGHPND